MTASEEQQPPPQAGFTERQGVRLHYLDWGGQGPPLVWLHGLGYTAQIFREIAPAFLPHHRVLALTRRGHGLSDWPVDGYSVASLTADVAAFIRALDLHGVILVGHSIAGNELTALAGLLPERIAALVYLDVALDRAGVAERIRLDPVKPQPPTFAVETVADARRLGQQRRDGFWDDALEANLWDSVRCDEAGRLKGGPTPGPALVMRAQEEHVPQYQGVRCPALALYATYTENTPHWGLEAETNEEVRREAAQFMREVMQPWQRASIERFRREVPQAKIVEWPDAHHDLHLYERDRVVTEIQDFLDDL